MALCGGEEGAIIAGKEKEAQSGPRRSRTKNHKVARGRSANEATAPQPKGGRS